MKYLIMTCSTGGGHHSAAAAVSEEMTAHGHECVIMDCLDFLPPAKARLISEGHVLLYRKAPKLFGLGYRFEETHTPKFMLSQCEAYAEKFYEAVMDSGCDAVINVHVFAALMMTAAKRRCHLDLPGFFIATDYTCSPGVGLADQDLFFIPHESLKEEFVRNGVPTERIVPTGIPVGPEYCTSVSRETARKQLGLPTTGSMVLLTCGSMGAGPMAKLTRLLDQAMAPKDNLVVLCGTNRKLKQKLDRTPLSNRTRVFGFVDEMHQYLDVADLILTKAGGLATTEALMKHLPIVYVDAVPGCETRNLEFMTEHGYAVTADTPEDLSILICTLLRDRDQLGRQTAILDAEFTGIAAERIRKSIEKYQ